MSGRRSRNKGSRGELEVAKIINDRLGLELHRTPNSGAFKWHDNLKGDVQGWPGMHLEVKRAERLQIPKWLEQTEDDCPDGSVPLLVFRQSHQPWRVVMRLDDLLTIMMEEA